MKTVARICIALSITFLERPRRRGEFFSQLGGRDSERTINDIGDRRKFAIASALNVHPNDLTTKEMQSLRNVDR